MVVAAGVETQEYTYLSLAERKDLIRRTIELIDGRVPVMVGISHASFRTAIELAHDAERLGRRRRATACAAPPLRGPADAGRPDRLFRGDRPRNQIADHALSQPRPRRRRLDPRHHRARQAAAGAAHQGKLARPRPRLAADRRDRPRRPRPLLHHHADAAGDIAAWRFRRDHAAARLRDRARRDRRFRREGLRARRGNPASVRAVPIEVDASGARAGHEGGDEPDRHSRLASRTRPTRRSAATR